MGFNIKDGEVVRYLEEPGVTEVVVPEGVTEIGDYAFNGCKSLTSVVLPEGLKEIGPYAFMYCTSLVSVRIPDSVEKLGESLFYECVSLTDVTLPAGLKEIEKVMFARCSRLTSVTLPDGLEEIGGGAFHGCESLPALTIPDSVTAVGARAFEGCRSLTSLVLPPGLRTIEESLFSWCGSLTTVTIPDSVAAIGEGAFEGCKRLRTLRWGDRSLPTPARYREMTDEAMNAVIDLLVTDFDNKEPDGYPEEKAVDDYDYDRALGVLLAHGEDTPHFWEYLKLYRDGVLDDRIEQDDAASVQRILARTAPLPDDLLDSCIGYAGEVGAKTCYLVLVNEKNRRGLLDGGEKRL